MGAQYARVGATESHLEISGARSIVETLPGQVNARDTAAALKQAGFDGCWVLALGTTDTANVAVGSNITRMDRIDRMMEVIGDDPVMWVDVKTLVGSGAWSNPEMAKWNATLVEAQAKYPNIKVYNWTQVVQDAWFSSDRIHYTGEGYAERARLIADALAATYPGLTRLRLDVAPLLGGVLAQLLDLLGSIFGARVDGRSLLVDRVGLGLVRRGHRWVSSRAGRHPCSLMPRHGNRDLASSVRRRHELLTGSTRCTTGRRCLPGVSQRTIRLGDKGRSYLFAPMEQDEDQSYHTPRLLAWRRRTDGPLLVVAIGSLPLLVVELRRDLLPSGDRLFLTLANLAVLVAFAIGLHRRTSARPPPMVLCSPRVG